MKINTNFNQLETALAVSGAELKFKYNLVRENQEIINTKKRFNKNGSIKDLQGIELNNIGGLIFFEKVLVLGVENQKKVKKKKIHFSHCNNIELVKENFQNFEIKLPESKDFDVDFEKNFIHCNECFANTNWNDFNKAEDWARRLIKTQFNLGHFYDHVFSFEKEIQNEILTKNNLKNYPDNFPRILEIIKAKKNWRCEICNLDCSGYKKLLHVENLSEDFDSIVPSDYKSKCLRCLKKEFNHIYFSKDELAFFDIKF